MGCDIHVHIEFKVAGKWRHYARLWVNRNYTLFTKMAGVRNEDDIIPISLPKGLPNDMSWETKFDADIDEPDMHSASWLSGQELVELSNWIDDQKWPGSYPGRYADEMTIFGYFFGNSYAGFYQYPRDWRYSRKKEIEDVRFVFWFDN